jgi:hypothetical protein
MAGKLTASILADPSSGTDNITLGATGDVALGAAASVTGRLTLGTSGIRIINGSNTTNIVAPTTAVTTTLTLPATTGTVALTSDITGGMTLLGTLTTTSGTSAVLSSLTLTSYKQLNIVYNNVSFTASATLTLNTIAISGTIATAANGNWGQTMVDLNVGTFVTSLATAAASSGTASSTSFNNAGGNCGVTTATTTLTFSGGTFDAGTIYVYGVK